MLPTRSAFPTLVIGGDEIVQPLRAAAGHWKVMTAGLKKRLFADRGSPVYYAAIALGKRLKN